MDRYSFTVTFTRELSDDLEIVGHDVHNDYLNAVTRDKLTQQFRKELQAAYDHPDTAIAGSFKIDKIVLGGVQFPAARLDQKIDGGIVDPNVAWKALQSALLNRIRVDVAICADNLIGWLQRDGFMPTIVTWQGELNRHQLLCYLRDIRHVAESE